MAYEARMADPAAVAAAKAHVCAAADSIQRYHWEESHNVFVYHIFTNGDVRSIRNGCDPALAFIPDKYTIGMWLDDYEEQDPRRRRAERCVRAVQTFIYDHWSPLGENGLEAHAALGGLERIQKAIVMKTGTEGGELSDFIILRYASSMWGGCVREVRKRKLVREHLEKVMSTHYGGEHSRRCVGAIQLYLKHHWDAGGRNAMEDHIRRSGEDAVYNCLLLGENDAYAKACLIEYAGVMWDTCVEALEQRKYVEGKLEAWGVDSDELFGATENGLRELVGRLEKGGPYDLATVRKRLAEVSDDARMLSDGLLELMKA